MASMAMSASADAPHRHAARAIFLMHYKRTLLPLALGCFGVLPVLAGVMWIARRFDRVESIVDIVTIAAAVLPLLVAAPAGGSAFSKPFKDQHILFFHALPMSRAKQWLLIVMSSAAALLTVIAGMCVVRPALLSLVTVTEAAIYLAIVGALFVSGTCFSLVIRNTVAAVIVSVITLPVTFTILVLASSLPMRTFAESAAWGRDSFSADRLGAFFQVVSAVVVLSIFGVYVIALLLLSLAFYVRGEITLLKTQIVNFGIVVVTALAIVVAGVPLANAIGASTSPYTLTSFTVSPDGRYVAQTDSRSAFPYRARLRITEIDSGKRVERRIDGIVRQWWIAPNRLAVTLCDLPRIGRLGALLPQSDRIVTVTPQGDRVSEWHRPRTTFSERRPTQSLVGVRDGKNVMVERVDAAGNVAELLQGRGEEVLFGEDIVYFDDPGHPRILRVSSGEELPWTRNATKNEIPRTIRGVVYSHPDFAATALERETPLPRAAGEGVRYVVGDTLRDRRNLYGVVIHAAGNGALYVLRDGTRSWALVAGDIVLDPPLTPAPRHWRADENTTTPDLVFRGCYSLAFHPRRDVAFYVVNGSVFAHDAANGTTKTLFAGDGGAQFRLAIFNDWLTSAMDTASLFIVAKGEGVRARFDLTGGEIVPQTHRGVLLVRRADGSEVRHDNDRSGHDLVVLYAPDGRLLRRLVL